MKPLAFILPLLAVTACAGPKYVQSSDVRVVTASELPAPTAADDRLGDRPSVIGVSDLLTIDVFGIPELSREVRVDSAGRISLPVAGEILAAGKSPGELQAAVRERLIAGYVRNPGVSINIREAASRVVTLDGEVEKPGAYPVVGRMTMLRAVALAQGTSDFAKIDRVVILRTVNGRDMAALYDLGAIRAGAYKDPEIYPNDVIVVGDSAAKRIFPQLVSAGALLLSPVIALLN